eukprot:15448281-Alexandrium_andersonii.AAC.1
MSRRSSLVSWPNATWPWAPRAARRDRRWSVSAVGAATGAVAAAGTTGGAQGPRGRGPARRQLQAGAGGARPAGTPGG